MSFSDESSPIRSPSFLKICLSPNLQDEEQYADSLRNLVETGKSVAKRYFQDGSIEKACPPLKALLELMSEGSGDGKSLQDKEFRSSLTQKRFLAAIGTKNG